MQHKTTGAADLEQPLPSITPGCLLISFSLSLPIPLKSQIMLGFLK
jgi:hypothetical protein